MREVAAMGLRGWVKKLEHAARGELESFELLDGSRYYYDPAETNKELFLHAYDVYMGITSPTPEIYHKICAAKNPEAALNKIAAERPSEFIDPAALYDYEALVHERRLVPIIAPLEPPEDLSED
jgi:hypothetical protein